MLESLNRKFEIFFGPADTGFKLFSLQHIIPVLLTLIIILLLYRYREPLKKSKHEKNFRTCLAVILLIGHMSFTWHATYVGESDMGNVLPLMLCYMGMLLGIFMLLNKSQYLFDILYFWAVCGTSTALLYPASTNEYSFLRFRYYQYWIGHSFLIIAVFYMLFVLGFKINFKSVIRSFGWIIPYSLFTLYVNGSLGTNYMFLSTDRTLWNLGFIPPFPYNYFFLLSAGILLMALAYLPFYLQNRKGKVKVLKLELTEDVVNL